MWLVALDEVLYWNAVTFCNLIGLQWMLQSLDQYSVYTNARLDHRGSHLNIARRSIVTRIKYPDLALVAWLFPSEALDCLILQWFKGQKHCHTSLVAEKMCWWVDVSSWSLDQVVTKIQNGTEWNGTVPPTKIRNTRNGTVTEQSGLVVWLEFNGTDHGLLPVNNERIFALQMAKVVYNAKYPLVIDYNLQYCSVTVPFRAFRILVGGTVPFRSGF